MLTSVRFRKVHIHKIMHSIYSRIAGRDECVLCLRSEFMWSLWQILFPYIIWTSSMVDHVATKTNIYIVIYDAHISQQPQTHFGPVDGAFSLFNQPRSIEANRPTNANTNAHQHFLIGTNIYTHLYKNTYTHTHTQAQSHPQRKCYANHKAFPHHKKIGDSRQKGCLWKFGIHEKTTTTKPILKTLLPDVVDVVVARTAIKQSRGRAVYINDPHNMERPVRIFVLCRRNTHANRETSL